MYAYANQGHEKNNYYFSPCTVNAIGEVLRSKSPRCFKAEASSYCGNDRIEADEECDAGLNGRQGLDKCCDANCRFERALSVATPIITAVKIANSHKQVDAATRHPTTLTASRTKATALAFPKTVRRRVPSEPAPNAIHTTLACATPMASVFLSVSSETCHISPANVCCHKSKSVCYAVARLSLFQP
jgi:hypothetical protein